jgi:hypothetical protein
MLLFSAMGTNARRHNRKAGLNETVLRLPFECLHDPDPFADHRHIERSSRHAYLHAGLGNASTLELIEPAWLALLTVRLIGELDFA